MELFVEKRVSTKSKKEYVALFLSLNGKEYMLSVDDSLIIKLLDYKPSELINMVVGKKVVVK